MLGLIKGKVISRNESACVFIKSIPLCVGKYNTKVPYRSECVKQTAARIAGAARQVAYATNRFDFYIR